MCDQMALIRAGISEFTGNAFNRRQMCESKRRLDGKVVIVTGANTGIGKETALLLSQRGAKVYIGCRNLDKAEAAVNDIKEKNPNADIVSLKLDLSSFKSVREFANQMKEREQIIDVLINNAGVMSTPEEWTTEDGFEMQFGTNYLGPFLLTMLLLPHLKRAPKARIVNVSAKYYYIAKIELGNINLRNGAYEPIKAYAQSKLAQLFFTRELAKRLGPDSNVNVYVLHPGVIKTELNRHNHMGEYVKNIMFIEPEVGAQTTLYCTLDESLDNETGFYYENCKREPYRKNALDDDMAHNLWEMSVDLVNLDNQYRI